MVRPVLERRKLGRHQWTDERPDSVDGMEDRHLAHHPFPKGPILVKSVRVGQFIGVSSAPQRKGTEEGNGPGSLATNVLA